MYYFLEKPEYIFLERFFLYIKKKKKPFQKETLKNGNIKIEIARLTSLLNFSIATSLREGLESDCLTQKNHQTKNQTNVK